MYGIVVCRENDKLMIKSINIMIIMFSFIYFIGDHKSFTMFNQHPGIQSNVTNTEDSIKKL